MGRRNILVDFDGTINGYQSGWLGYDNIPDPPVPGAREAIAAIRKDFNVLVFSTRCEAPEGILAIQEWLKKHDIEVDGVTASKTKASLLIDDRAYRFDGNWAKAVEFVQSGQALKTWMDGPSTTISHRCPSDRADTFGRLERCVYWRGHGGSHRGGGYGTWDWDDAVDGPEIP